MNTLVTILPGVHDEWLPVPRLAASDADSASVAPAVANPALSRRLRQIYGVCKLLGAPRAALQLFTAPAGSALAQQTGNFAAISALAAQPFVCSRWSSGLRLRRIIEHCAIIDKLGHPFAVDYGQFVEIISFCLDGSRCRLTLDKPDWLACDGLLCASLWVEADRVFSITFCLSGEGSIRRAYVGGIQGRRDGRALEQNRALTKAAHGMRPKDLAFELFRMLMPHLGVAQIRCVSDACRYQKSRRAIWSIGANDQVQLDYDEFWTSRGGVREEDGFFLVPSQPQHRDIAHIPGKKRAMYARRYAFLDGLNAAVETALASRLVILQHAGVTQGSDGVPHSGTHV